MLYRGAFQVLQTAGSVPEHKWGICRGAQLLRCTCKPGADCMLTSQVIVDQVQLLDHLEVAPECRNCALQQRQEPSRLERP